MALSFSFAGEDFLNIFKLQKGRILMKVHQKLIFLYHLIIIVGQLFSCKTQEKLYNFKKFPKTYESAANDYENYYRHNGCKPRETIASIGAGNGIKEIQISYFVEGVTWFLQEIDSARLYQFNQVLEYHKQLKGTPSIDAEFNLVIGTENTTKLPNKIFDRVLMMNVFHEIVTRENILPEIHQLLKSSDGELVIMERMAKTKGEYHGDCKFPKLQEENLLQEMHEYGFRLEKRILAEKLSNLIFFTFIPN